MRADMGDKARELLLNGLVLDLMAGRNAAVDRYAHGVPPAGSGVPALRPARAEWPSIAGGAGRPVPALLAGGHRRARAPDTPRAPHARLRSELPHREVGAGRPHVARPARGASSEAAAPCASGRTCHLRLGH